LRLGQKEEERDSQRWELDPPHLKTMRSM
jgi:hypothetical protein